MAPRPYWKGYLRLSLVTCPVVLYSAATQAERTHFHMIKKETGNRLHQQMVNEETGEMVEKENKGRGYEPSKGKYVEIEPVNSKPFSWRAHVPLILIPLCLPKKSTSAITTTPIISRLTASLEAKHS